MKRKAFLVFISCLMLLFHGTTYGQSAERPPSGLTFVTSSDSGVAAQTLKSLKLATKGESVEATIEGDGVLLYGVYVAQPPFRLVVDILGVGNQFKTQLLPKPHPFFERARAYEFPAEQEYDKGFSRIVFDLRMPVAYRVTPSGRKLKIELLPESTVAAQATPSSQNATTSPQNATPPPQNVTPSPNNPTSSSKNPTSSPAGSTAPAAVPQSSVPNPAPSTDSYARFIEPAGIDPKLFFGTSSTESNEYQLGPEDVLQINVFQLSELNVTARVSGTGTITLALIGTLNVQGMTANSLAEKIAQLLGEKYLQDPQVTVFVTEFNSQKISMIGKLQTPGSYPLVGKRTIIQLIAQAGGIAEGAGKTIFVFRQAPDGRSARLSIPVEDLLVKGDPKWNIWVKPGDVVSVPVIEQISISVLGAVGTPGTVVFSGSDGCTLLNAIARAGGLRQASKSIKIRRKGATGSEMVLEANLGDILSGKKPDVQLEEGDVIVVKESFF